MIAFGLARQSATDLRVTRIVALGCGLLVATAIACEVSSKGSKNGAGEGANLPDGGTFRRAELLEAFGTCAERQAGAFVPAAQALETALAAAEANPDATTLAAAQQAWRTAIEAWSINEMLQFGPGGPKSRAGGRDWRESIYSWPLGGRCSIEEKLVDKSYENGLAGATVNVRGLLAIEYLLFYTGTDNACTSSGAINADGSWAAIPADELTRRKLAYARQAATLVTQKAQEIEAAWDPAAGNFLAEFTSAGKGSRTYQSDAIAFNVVSDSLFYLEYELKDIKLAHPMGLRDCANAVCPEDVESSYAKHGKAQLRQNLVGAKLLLAGCGENGSGLGFDDMFYALGQEPIARDMVSGLDQAIAAADAIGNDDLSKAILEERDKVDALYNAVKSVTDRLKNDFVAVLDLEIPRRVEGDND